MARAEEKVQRHTMEQLADVAPMEPSLAVPKLQTLDQLVAVIKPVDSLVPEQSIAVPKISSPSRFPRTVLREPQKAEQLVEVPTILFFLKQTVDTRGGYGGLLGFHPGQGSLQRIVEQIVDIPVPGGELQDFPPDAGCAALPAVSPGEPFLRSFFALFPDFLNAKVAARSSAREPAHSRPGLRTMTFTSRRERTWTLDSISTSSCIWQALGPVFTRQFTVAFGRISVIIHVVLGNLDTTSTFTRWLDSFCAMPGSTVDTCTSTVLGIFWTNFHLFLGAGVDSDPVVDQRPALLGDFHVFAAWRSVPSRCFDCMDGPSSLHLQSGHYVMSPLCI